MSDRVAERDAMARPPNRQPDQSPLREQTFTGAADVGGAGDQAAKVQTLPGLDGHVARELVRGLVESAIAKGVDPAARLQQFRTLQQAAIAMSQNPAAAQTAERLVCAIDLILQELTTVKS